MTKTQVLVLLALAAAPAAIPVRAGSIPYPDVGTELTHGIDIIAAGGPVKAYFYGSDAYFHSTLYLDAPVSVGPALENHSSAPGQLVNFGSFPAGTLLRFRLYVDRRDGTFRDLYSGAVPAPNGDTEVHAYIAPWTPGMIPGSNVTVSGDALFIGFEDVNGSTSDWDYNDHQFVLSNLKAETIPEPGTFAMLAAGAVLLSLFARRRAAH